MVIEPTGTEARVVHAAEDGLVATGTWPTVGVPVTGIDNDLRKGLTSLIFPWVTIGDDPLL
jgi:hypothetical protein